MQVHMQNVTVYADEHAALQLVSQGSMQNAGRRNSRSKQEPLELIERRRSHLRASTPSANDMQTGAPSLDFQIMYVLGALLCMCSALLLNRGYQFTSPMNVRKLVLNYKKGDVVKHQ